MPLAVSPMPDDTFGIQCTPFAVPLQRERTSVSGPYDIFICHDHAAAAAVKRLTAALAARGVACFDYEASDSSELQPKLATSKSFLAWASAEFFQSRGCQTHLAMAWLASGQDPQNAPSRLMLVNAAGGLKHIYPLSLRKHLIATAPGLPDALDYPALAEQLHTRCDALTGSLGGLYPGTQDGWLEPYDRLSHPPAHFAGRARELWDIHLALNTPASPGQPRRGAVLSGAAGLSKSLLTREYAFRFGAAYPGGIYRLSGSEAQPVLRLRELAENPALKPQLLGLLHQLQPDHGFDDATPLAALSARLGEILGQRNQSFLWIVDNLADGVNGPTLRQWLAPAPQGRTLFITRSQRYDQRAEPVHLPMLDESSALTVLSPERPPSGRDEQDASRWLLDEVARHPRFAAMLAALTDHRRHKRRGAFTRLLHRFDRKIPKADELAHQLIDLLPADHAPTCAAILVETLKILDGPARDLLRLGAELAEHPLSLEFIRESLVISGLGVDDRQEDLFTLFLNEPQEVPLTRDTVASYVEQGVASLARHALAERTDQGVMLSPLATRALHLVVPASPRQMLLRESALQALYIQAETCLASRDWGPLDALAPHGRTLIADLRERTIESEDSGAEITGRTRLALHLADRDLAHGARRRALDIYRAVNAYLIRAMAVDSQNSVRQRDFARVQEQLGDLLAEQGHRADALEHYRKSLGIRVYMARQESAGLERVHDPLRLHIKLRDLQQALGDAEGALQSQQAVLLLRAKLAQLAPDDDALAATVAESHAELAELYLRLGQRDAAMTELERALPDLERLAETHGGDVHRVRAPALVHGRMGDIMLARDDLSGALNRYRTALGIVERAARLEPGNPEWRHDVALYHKKLGETLFGLDDPAEAEAHFKQFLAIAEHPDCKPSFAGARAVDTAVVHIKLGRHFDTAKDLYAALAHYQSARPLLEQLAIDWPDNGDLRKDLGWLRNRIKMLEDRRESELRRLARSGRP